MFKINLRCENVIKTWWKMENSFPTTLYLRYIYCIHSLVVFIIIISLLYVASEESVEVTNEDKAIVQAGDA